MPPRKGMGGKQPAPSGSGQPPANSSRGSTGDGHSAVERSITLESSDGLHLAAEPAAGAKVVTQSNTGLGEDRPVKRVSLAASAGSSASSGVKQPAAESGANLAVEEAHSEKPAGGSHSAKRQKLLEELRNFGREPKR